MKKLLFLLVLGASAIWMYFWYVRGENLLDRHAAGSPLPAFAAGARSAGRDTAGALTRWRIAAPLPEPRLNAAAAALDGKVYVVGGLDPFDRTVATTYVFDIAANAWSEAAPLPRPVQSASVATDGHRVYVFGGFEGLAFTPVDRAYALDPESGRWTSLTDLPEPVGAAAAVWLDEEFHLIGGQGLGRSTQAHRIYRPASDTWGSGESITSGRDHLAAVALETRIYAVGGRAGSLVYNLDSFDIYHQDSHSWEQGQNLPAKRSALAAAAVEGTIYAFGGEAPSMVYGDVYAYDRKADRWKVADHMATPRFGFAAAEADGRIFTIAGGRRPGFSVSDVVEVFTP